MEPIRFGKKAAEFYQKLATFALSIAGRIDV